MRRYSLIIIAFILFWNVGYIDASKTFTKSVLTGGVTGCLDEIDGTDISDGDRAIVVDQYITRFYALDADSAEAEDSPFIISPDTNAGDKRWILSSIQAVVDSSQADQGAATSNGALTVKDFVDAYGSYKGIIICPHRFGRSETEYNFDTSEVLGSNLYLELEPGAVLTRTTGDETVTLHSPENLIVGKWKVTAADMLVFTEPGTGYAEWWGAIGDDGNSDTNALSYAANALFDCDGKLQLLAKSYTIDGPITILSANHYLKIQGEGIQSTHLVYSDTDATIDVTITGFQEGILDVSDLAMLGSANGTLTYPCISVTYSSVTTSYSYIGPTFRNIVYKNDTTRNTTINDAIIKLDNATHPSFDRIYMTSYNRAGIGIRLVNECIAPHFSDMFIHSCETAVTMEDESEGGSFVACNLTGNDVGILYDNDAAEPGGKIIGCHFGCSDAGIIIRNQYDVRITDNFFLKFSGSNPYTDIEIEDTAAYTIIANNIMNTDPESESDDTGIDLQGGVGHQVYGNHIRQRGTGIEIAAGVTNSRIRDNDTKGLDTPIDNSAVGTTHVGCGEITNVSCSVKRDSTHQSIPDTTLTAVTWDSIESTSTSFDADFWVVGNPSRLSVPPCATKITLNAEIQFASNATGYREVQLQKNGAVFHGGADVVITAVNGEDTRINVATGLLEVAEDDYFEVHVYQSSGGALDVEYGAHLSFTMTVVE